MDTLQRNGYDLAKAMSTLVPQGGPVLCRDEMEEWSASEAMLFEEALEKYGKDFNDIRQDFVSWEGGVPQDWGGGQRVKEPPWCEDSLLSLQLPWKSLASIVQFYYMWKTTDRYIQQVRGGGGGAAAAWGGSYSMEGLPQAPTVSPQLALTPSLLTEEAEGSGGGQQAEASLHPHLVSWGRGGLGGGPGAPPRPGRGKVGPPLTPSFSSARSQTPTRSSRWAPNPA